MLRIIAILLLCFIIVNLFYGLFAILKDRSSGTKTVKALTIRIGVSIFLFFLIMVSAVLGLWES